jgi:hypothetical protein
MPWRTGVQTVRKKDLPRVPASPIRANSERREVPVAESPSTSQPLAANAACHVARCGSAADYTPILCIALVGRERVSRVALPALVCGDHRDGFTERFLTPARRTKIEVSLRAHNRDSPDWSRTHIEFVAQAPSEPA